MSLDAGQRARLVARAREELPQPGDPRRLFDDLLESGLGSNEALEVAARSSLAWTQLRDMRLERSWQSGFGWFLARNLLLFGGLGLLYAVVARPQGVVIQSALFGTAVYYLIFMTLAPLRLRRHARRRDGILAAYHADLDGYLETLEGGTTDRHRTV